jgi:hypothetical protein
MTLAYDVDSPIDASHFERGVSEDAHKLSLLLRDIIRLPDPNVMSSSRGEALEALWSRYQSASTPNWDGEGADAVAHSTCEYATQFLGLLPSRIPEPEIYAESDGEIAFEWDLGPRRVVSVSVGRDGTLTFAGLMGTRKVSGVDTLTTRLPASIRAVLEAVIAGR